MSNSHQWRKPYQRAGTSFWWARLPVADGSNRERSLGVKDRKQALQALSILAASYGGSFRVKGLVFAVGRGDVSVAEFLDAHSRGELDALAFRIDNPDVDLNDHVVGWQEWLTGRGSTTDGTRAKYLQQLRAFVPDAAQSPVTLHPKGDFPFPKRPHNWCAESLSGRAQQFRQVPGGTRGSRNQPSPGRPERERASAAPTVSEPS